MNKLIICVGICMLMIMPVAFASIFDNKRPNEFYCKTNEQCASGSCINYNCGPESRASIAGLNGEHMIYLIKENAKVIQIILLIGVIVLIYLYYRRGK